ATRFLFFFFQAEDGIRDLIVTGVQTCALPILESALRQMCASQIRGDTYRDLVVDATFGDQRFKHILVPIWLMTYRYGAASYQVEIGRASCRERVWIAVGAVVCSHAVKYWRLL